MTLSAANIAPSNPFSTRFVRPGAIPYLFPAGQDLPTLLARLARQSWVGQIIGPHGTGKSTLIADLVGALRAAGREPQHYRLRDGIDTFPGWNARTLKLHSQSILIIDGFEQISPWRRWWLRRECRHAGSGLVVTAHTSIGLPDLFRTDVTLDLADQILMHLHRGSTPLVDVHDLEDRLRVRAGNLRDALFDLYDIHERRARAFVHSKDIKYFAPTDPVSVER